MANRTLPGAKATRCKATQSGQQCLRAKHSEMTGHTWGTAGETDQWNANNTAKPGPATDETVKIPAVNPTYEAVVPAAIAPPADGDPAGRGYGDLIRVLEHANTKRFEVERVIELRGIVDQLEREIGRWELSDPNLIAKGFHQFEAWAMQRGLRTIEAAGS